ncbi:MAG: hypothetical protein AAF491_10375 [Verrucomicrobiota bacterium]
MAHRYAEQEDRRQDHAIAGPLSLEDDGTMPSSFLVRLAPIASATTLCLLLGYLVQEGKVRAQSKDPASIMELIRSLEMTGEQEAEFATQEKFRIESQSRFRELSGEELRIARETFQAERKAALQELFTEDQWAKWDRYWSNFGNRTSGETTTAENSGAPAASTPSVNPEDVPAQLGKKGFVHAERQDGIWFLLNADGERFIPLGMNHVGPMHRFAPYNRDFWVERFGPETLGQGGQPNWEGPGMKRWMEQIAQDHFDHGFNTLAFHHPATLGTEYFNELGLYYFGKMKMSHVNPKRAPRMGRNGTAIGPTSEIALLVRQPLQKIRAPPQPVPPL